MAGIHREAVRSDLIIPTSRLDHRCLVIVAGRTHRLERSIPEEILISAMGLNVIRNCRWSGSSFPAAGSAQRLDLELLCQSRFRKFEQMVKWIFWLTAGTILPAHQEL
jgi:hypothetical protein